MSRAAISSQLLLLTQHHQNKELEDITQHKAFCHLIHSVVHNVGADSMLHPRFFSCLENQLWLPEVGNFSHYDLMLETSLPQNI